MTAIQCPQGCGTTFDSSEPYCPGCRRLMNATTPVDFEGKPEVSACMQWFGPDWHRMRCRKRPGHHGDHCCEGGLCGGETPSGSLCGKEENHEGPC